MSRCVLLVAAMLAIGAAQAADSRGLVYCVGADGWRLSSDFEGDTRVAGSPRGEQHAKLESTRTPPRCADSYRNQAPPDGMEIQYEGGAGTQRSATVITDPADPSNRVLRFELNEANVLDAQGRPDKGRVQLNTYGFPGARTVWMSVRMRLSPAFTQLRMLDRSFQWLTVAEWWNNPSWGGAPYPFRVTLNVVKVDSAVGAPLRLAAHAQAYDTVARRWLPAEWTAVAAAYELPVGRWVTLETRMSEGGVGKGGYRVTAVDEGGARTVVLDVVGATRHPGNPSPEGFTHINPIKLYTARRLIAHARSRDTVLSIDWDDLDVRGCKATESVPSARRGLPERCPAEK